MPRIMCYVPVDDGDGEDLNMVQRFWLSDILAGILVFALIPLGNSFAMDVSDGLCTGTEHAFVQVHVSNIREVTGNIRAQIYGDDPDAFLEKGAKLVRVDTPTLGSTQQVCVPLPGPGRYALVILHDMNANGKADFFSEGFGFSNNPDLGLTPPDYGDVVFAAPVGETRMDVTLKYMFGSSEDKKKKRNRIRRR